MFVYYYYIVWTQSFYILIIIIYLYIIYFYLMNDEFVKFIYLFLAFFKVLARFNPCWPAARMD